MALKDTIIADIKQIITDLDTQVITWNGQDYECVPGSDGTMATLEVGGFAVDADLVVTILKEQFTDDIYPVAQQKITYKTKTYRIEKVRDDVTDAFIRLFCINPARGI